MANDRSPNYPGFSLKACVSVARAIYDKERQSWMTHEIAARAMGYSSLSGPPRRKIGAMRKFGLLEGSGNNVRLSALAMTILFATSEDEKRGALKEAALKPDLYRELSKESGASDDNLVSGLIRRGFIPDGAKRAVASFRETMELVGTKNLDYDSGEDEESSMIESQSVATSGSSGPGLLRQHKGPGLREADYSWQLPQGVRVELRFAGGPFTRDGLRVLRKYLEVMEETMPDAVAATGSPIAPVPQPERSPDAAPDLDDQL